MINPIIDGSLIEQLKVKLTQYQQYVIVCHTSPDGDAMGSSMALYHLLKELKREAVVVVPDAAASNLMFLAQPSHAVINYATHTSKAVEAIKRAEAIICLDFNAAKRTGNAMAATLSEAKGYKIMIDHHLDPEPLCDLIISYPQMTSTCQLLLQCIIQMELRSLVTIPCAEAIYTGMMTDTGNFTYNSNQANLFQMVAILIDLGIDKDKVFAQIFHTNSPQRIRLKGYATSKKMTLYPEHMAAMITLTQPELQEYNYTKGDTEGLVNVPLSIKGIKYAVFFREDKDYIKVSLRSKGRFPVNQLAEKHFNGGGHLNASGGEFMGTMEEAMALFEEVLPLYDHFLED